MGLGKTVEILALILSNPWPKKDFQTGYVVMDSEDWLASIQQSPTVIPAQEEQLPVGDVKNLESSCRSRIQKHQEPLTELTTGTNMVLCL